MHLERRARRRPPAPHMDIVVDRGGGGLRAHLAILHAHLAVLQRRRRQRHAERGVRLRVRRRGRGWRRVRRRVGVGVVRGVVHMMVVVRGRAPAVLLILARGDRVGGVRPFPFALALVRRVVAPLALAFVRMRRISIRRVVRPLPLPLPFPLSFALPLSFPLALAGRVIHPLAAAPPPLLCPVGVGVGVAPRPSGAGRRARAVQPGALVRMRVRVALMRVRRVRRVRV